MTDDQTTTQGPAAPRLTPAALAEVYSLGAHRAIIDAAEGHAAAPMLRALAHVGGLAHAAAGYPRHLLSPLRDVLAAVDRLPDAAALAAWALGELPAGSLEPRPDGEVAALRARAEAAEQRAEALAAELAQARADARVLACQWRAVDDTEDLRFFGACWHEAHPGRSEGDLGRYPTMADLVAALRRALGGV